MLETDPKYPELIKEDPMIPPYNKIGEEILKGIEALTGSRDVLFKWKQNQKSSKESKDRSAWLIETFNSLPGGQHTQLCDEERERLENLGLIKKSEQSTKS